MLRKKIQQELVTALKNRDERKLSTLRLLLSQIKNQEIDTKKELDNVQIIQIVRKQINDLKEANQMFQKGKREDLIKENEMQIAVLKEYLPEELSDEKLEEEIKKIIADNQNLFRQKPKALIGLCIGQLKTKAESQRIINILKKSIRTLHPTNSNF